jgi:hypothetical protein
MDVYTVQNIISYFDMDTKLVMRRVSQLMYDNITISDEPNFPISSISKHGYRFIGCLYGSWRILANDVFVPDKLRADLEAASIGGNIHMFNAIRKISHVMGEPIEDDHMAIVDGFTQACTFGNYELVEYIITNRYEFPSVIDYKYWLSSGLVSACDNGEQDVIDLLLKYGAKSYNRSLISACCGGQLDVIKMLIEKGANKIHSGLVRACAFGHLHVVMYILEHYNVPLKESLRKACRHGYQEIVELLLSRGAKFTRNSFDDACIGGNYEVVKRIIKCGIISRKNAIRWALSCTTRNG